MKKAKLGAYSPQHALEPAPDKPERRRFLARGAKTAGAIAVAGTGAMQAAAQAQVAPPPWMQKPGAQSRGYGVPSKFEEKVQRTWATGYAAVSPGTGSSRTPLQSMNGSITPNGLHFERHHNGVPEIDPARHQLVIHGMVSRPLTFSVDALLRYPMVSRVHFVECAGNSGPNTLGAAPQANVQAIHGLLSCAEWRGVPLATLLNEGGIDPKSTWMLAEGADAAAMSRSFPVAKAFDDAMVALYQNGERIRPEQGYPMRLLVPGYQGNMNVKWLRRLKATDEPTHTRDETSKYSNLLRDGKAHQFPFVLEVKSVITHPSGGGSLQGPGLYEISGLAWSGAGRIARVEVSTDGGATWSEASLDGVAQPKAAPRVGLPGQWPGAGAILQSRATDDKGNVQPSRAVWTALYSPGNRYHNNMIQTWAIGADGSVKNVYA
jgi:sulfane dehydrogenase subunit SoxC